MLNVISPINQLGYGITGLNICKSLNERSSISLWPIGQPSVTNQKDADLISELISNSSVPDFDAPCIRIWHQHDMSQFVGGGLKVGFPIFELDSFNKVEAYHLNYLDRVFVCSEWAKGVVDDQTNINNEHIHVIPLGVDTNIFNQGYGYASAHVESPTVFFNCGKWEYRKGHDVLVEAFNNAFDKSDSVELWMMCENPFLSEDEQSEWINLYKGSNLGEKIKIIPRKESQEEVYNIMKQADCGVFPSRAEGWNLELLEMMACGKRVIATNYSAHTEFCNNDNSILINSDSREVAYDGRWFHGDSGSWFKHDSDTLDQLSSAMRSIYEEDKCVNREGIATARQFSWQNSAIKIYEALDV